MAPSFPYSAIMTAALSAPSAKPPMALATACIWSSGRSCLNWLTARPRAWMARPAPLLSSVVLARFLVSLFMAPPMVSAVWSLYLPTAARPLNASTVEPVCRARSCRAAPLSTAPLTMLTKAPTVKPAARPAATLATEPLRLLNCAWTCCRPATTTGWPHSLRGFPVSAGGPLFDGDGFHGAQVFEQGAE